MEFWGYAIGLLFVLVLIRAWFLMGKISLFIDNQHRRQYLHDNK